MSVSNMEEAASVAAEYISSLDNLPSEIQFLLAEIRHKEARSQELQQEIHKDSNKYTRHALRAPGAPASARDAALPEKIRADYAEADRLADEKLALARRAAVLIARARTRLDHDLARMLVLQGELEPALQGSFAVVESLRGALATPEIALTPAAQPAAAAVPAQKRRKLNATTSIKLSSPAPASVYVSAVAGRGARQGASTARHSPVRGRRGGGAVAEAIAADGDEDAEGEEDVDDGGDGDGDEADGDDAIYCFCQQKSYGEMVACDGKDCPYQWFHLECVSLRPPLPEHFYCSECVQKGQSERGRRGRKK